MTLLARALTGDYTLPEDVPTYCQPGHDLGVI